MKKSKIIAFIMAAVTTAIPGFVACTSEAPFAAEEDGTLILSTQLKGDIKVATRADEAQYDKATLEKNLVVYIENSKGVIRKFLGRESIPESVMLQPGNYVIEGWTGDSASADFSKKFYRGYQKFEIAPNQQNEVVLSCNIANVVVSVNAENLSDVSDLKVSVNHTKGNLIFDSQKISDKAKGYFMMPNNDNSLHYVIEGKNSNGQSFKKEGIIENVQRAYEYVLTLKSDPSEITVGGALLKIDIVEVPLIEQEFVLLPGPTFKLWNGNNPLDISKQVNAVTMDTISDLKFRSVMYDVNPNGHAFVGISFSNNFPDNLSGFSINENLLDNPDKISQINSAGISFSLDSDTEEIENSNVKVSLTNIIIPRSYIEELLQSETEYVITIDVRDDRGYSNTAKIRFARSETAIEREAPIVINTEALKSDYTLIRSKSATIPIIINPDAVEPKLQYRIKGTETWTGSEDIVVTRAMTATEVKLFGLTPNSEYEYRVVTNDFESEIEIFKTEPIFTIPNASMEEWSKSGKVLIPSSDGTVSFWDTGNHGSSTMNKLVTNYSVDIFHSGSNSAELKSQFVGFGSIGKFAAGNLFVGSYDETDGTDGVLTFGRQYNGSHPSALSVWAKYIPGKVDNKVKTHEYLKEGDIDKGQIYIALTTGNVKVKTKNKQLFNKEGDKNADCEYDVIAYGEITWESVFDDGGNLKNVNIPLTYTEKAKTIKPTHLIIVCSASKYGDYFEGGEGSVMYLDDFELVYE